MANLAYIDEIPAEILDGKTVALSPRPTVNHNIIAGNIYHIFKRYLKGKPCKIFGEVDVYLTEKDRVIPDLMIVCDSNIIKPDGIYGPPDLIVEILSPGTIRRDRGYKKDLYEKSGVKEYWLVDLGNSSVEVYLLTERGFSLDEIYTLFPEYLINKMTNEEKNDIKYEFKTSLYPDLTISINEIFEGRF